MKHENDNTECSDEGFIMSEKKNLPIWSPCNAVTAQTLFQKECLFNEPPRARYFLNKKYSGKNWPVLRQCQTQLG